MKNEKIRTFYPANTRNEKTISLSGFLSLPLRVNERAFILQGGQNSILTSTVKEILEVSSSGVVFRTCNTLYRLSYTSVPNTNEVMCA